ncbi:hypothetical protein ES703_16978 [subsurface metagenome]
MAQEDKITQQERELLVQLDGAYSQKRLSEMGKLQNSLVKEIVKAKLPSQDVLMVLVVLSRQIEVAFIGKLHPKQETPEKKEE